MQGDLIYENKVVVAGSASPPTAPTRNAFVADFQLGTNNNHITQNTLGTPRYERAFDVIFRNNYFESIYPVTASGSGSDSMIRVYNAAGFINPHSGAFIGATNFLIEGNTFIGPSDKSVGAIYGSFVGTKIRNNKFVNMEYAFLTPNPIKEDILIEGNEFINCGYVTSFLGNGVNWIGTNYHNRVTMRNNLADGLDFEFFRGAADNLTIEGNTIRNFSRFGVTNEISGFNPTINVTTNDIWTGSGSVFPRVTKNNVIRNNTLEKYPVVQETYYWFHVDGSTNMVINGNKHNTYFGEEYASTAKDISSKMAGMFVLSPVTTYTPYALAENNGGFWNSNGVLFWRSNSVDFKVNLTP
jgi:hypothetical protein